MLRPKGKIVTPRSYRKLTYADKVKNAVVRAKHKLGDEEYSRVKRLLQTIDDAKGSSKPVLDGIIMGLLQRNLSNNEIRSVYKVGNSRINRIRKVMNNPSLISSKRPRPSHAAVEADLNNLKTHLESYETEDGFPCAHRRPRKFFIKEGLRWRGIWRTYKACMDSKEPPCRALSFVR